MKLDLYMFEGCPYCTKVLKYMDDNHIDFITIHDIHKNEADRKILIETGGMEQVPCLFIDGRPMYESDDIVHWLQKNLV